MSMKILEKNRIKVYDKDGNLVEERDVTLEDLKELILKELSENYYIEFTFTIGTQTVTVRASLKKKT